MPAQLSVDARSRLERLLMTCYPLPKQLYRFYGYLPDGLTVVRELAFPASPSDLAHHGVRQLEACGMVQAQLFALIAADRPNRMAEIAEVARSCGVAWPVQGVHELPPADRPGRRSRAWFELLPPSRGCWQGWVAVVRPDFPLLERNATTPRDLDDLSCRAVGALARGVAEGRAALRSGRWGPDRGEPLLYCVQRNASCMLISRNRLDAQMCLFRALELLCGRCDAPLVGGLAYGDWDGNPPPFLTYGVTGEAPQEAVGLIREIGTWKQGGTLPRLRLAVRREGRSAATLELPGSG